jgi:hypothetical protein
MKPIFRLVGVALTILVSSCQKEKDNSLSLAEEQGLPKASLRVYFDDGTVPGVEGVNYGCSGTGGNCLNDVVVTSELKPAMDNVFSAAYSANDEQIRAAFQTNKAALLNYVSSKHVNGVITGAYTARARGAAPGYRYLMIRDTAVRIVGVYPLK